METLQLTLKKKWFDMILSGEKKEEYRDIKPYWIARMHFDLWNTKPFDAVKFTNGYGKNAPTFTIELYSMHLGTGKTEWGAIDDTEYYVLTLGNIICKS